MTHTSPWHDGERELQRRAGVEARMALVGTKVIRDYMPDQHRTFFAQLPFLVVASVDAAGNPWVTLVEAPAGLAHSPDPKTLIIHRLPSEGDPVAAGLVPGAAIGILGIELQTRRRNRVNGTIAGLTTDSLSLQVEHSFGNCPQYIHTRDVAPPAAEKSTPKGPVEVMSALDADAVARIRAADTFYIASYADVGSDLDDEPQRRQIDASHRGGKPGFIRVDGQILSIPDFAGNLHFNTLGNLLVNPRAGITFVDFTTGDLLQLSGRTELVADEDDIAHFQGAERLWRLHVQQVVRRRAALGARAKPLEPSPNSLMTGSWEEADARGRAKALGNEWRQFHIERVIEESPSITSFYLRPTDGAGLMPFRAGQHLPIRIREGVNSEPVIRTYTLSVAPSDSCYRISVKRAGRVSGFLHTHGRVGATLEARAPNGRFVVDAHETRPLVLLAAGVGITPLLAMLREVVYEGLRRRSIRSTYVFYGARSLVDLAFASELNELQQRGQPAICLIRVLSQPEAQAKAGQDYEHAGHIDLALLKSVLPFDDFDFYLCGPGGFTQGLYDALRQTGVADARVHAEQFGPSTLKRSDNASTVKVQPAQNATAVSFARSAQDLSWAPGDGSLLELAEAAGLAPEFSCRGGSCGTCKCKLVSGEVSYLVEPTADLAEDEVLPCCCVPAAMAEGSGGLVLDL